MKATLINPPSPFLIDERVFPYLGILNLATVMRKDGHDVDVVDLSGNKEWEQTVSDLPRADMFGVTSTSAQYKFAHKIARLLGTKGQRVIGGTHVNNLVDTNDEKNLRDLEVFDTVFVGEGEKYHGVEDAGRRFDAGFVKNLDDIPIADREFYDIGSYHYEIDGRPATTMLTQRGCPYNCDFCSGRFNPMYRTSRQHSAKRVVEEMSELEKKFGYKGFMWFDDEININPQRLQEIAERTKGKDYRHRGFLRSDLLLKHPEQLKHLWDMGFRDLCIGVESGSDRILKLEHKGTTRAKNLAAAKMIKDAGFGLKTFCMIGHPSETRDDVEATCDFLREAKPDHFDVAMLQPYPGSRIYNEAQPSTEFEGYDWEYNGLYFNKPRFSKEVSFHKGIPGTYKCHVRTDTLSSQDITNLRDEMQSKLEKELRV